MKKIIVTGGCGYIGSHIIVSLLEKGYQVFSIDSLENGNENVPESIKKITGKEVHNFKINLCNLKALRAVLLSLDKVDGIIHCAAFKSVSESVFRPMRYYANNISSMMNVLLCVREFNVPHFVYSSSSSVYGNISELPVTENTPVIKQESPYARTKYIGEMMIDDMMQTHVFKSLKLRYFNPAGSHDSGLLGEVLTENPTSIVPAITRTAIGKQKQFVVNGIDYATRDGSCIRDYVHVMDIANAHLLALQYLMGLEDATACNDIMNLGTGNGVSVLEMIKAFEKASGKKLNVKNGERRTGDAIAVYSDCSKAKNKLGWEANRTLEQMMQSAWQWEQLNNSK